MNDEKYKVKWTGAFKKDYKLIQKRGYDTELLKEVVLSTVFNTYRHSQ